MRYKFTHTPKITSLTKQLHQQSYFIRQFPLQPQLITNLRRQSTLKSSLFSARIEGNLLTLNQVSTQPLTNTHDLQKLEIQNLNSALNYIFSSRCPATLSHQLIKTLHRYVLKNISGHAGSFRTEQTAIFNQAGVAVYLTPPPSQIKPQLQQMYNDLNHCTLTPYIKAAVNHFWFQKIHPFVDGNGRIGRLLTQHLIDHRAKNFRGLLAFEEQIDQFRSEYYSLLQSDSSDLTPFIEFYLEMFILAANQAITTIKSVPTSPSPIDNLLPRRQEIYHLIQDHTHLSFDQIRRRFMAVNQSTLRHDLRQLLKANLIKKLGSTRGALYTTNHQTV